MESGVMNYEIGWGGDGGAREPPIGSEYVGNDVALVRCIKSIGLPIRRISSGAAKQREPAKVAKLLLAATAARSDHVVDQRDKVFARPPNSENECCKTT